MSIVTGCVGQGIPIQKLSKVQKRTLLPKDAGETDRYATKRAPAAPKLPSSGREIFDFVPEGWELLDDVETDFNGDGVRDFVGVLEKVCVEEETDESWPRVLFAVASDGNRYLLDFQDENLIRTAWEGGVFGDPYLPLTAEGASFTTHSFGGSAWKWSEDYTYTYKSGEWYLTMAEISYGYGDYITSYSKCDWEKGTGIYKERSSEFDHMEERWEEEGYDIEYELTLDEPYTLYEAGKRWWLSTERIRDWEVKTIEIAGDVDLSEKDVKLPESGDLYDYCDEDCVLYRFSVEKEPERWNSYLAMYRWQDKTLSVLAESTSNMDDPVLYKGKIYYSEEINETISYRDRKSGENTEAEETVGIWLKRMNTDGTGKESILEYRYYDKGQKGVEESPPYLGLIYKISGDEIVAEIYIGNGEKHPVYRMNTDGTEKRQIGQIPA